MTPGSTITPDTIAKPPSTLPWPNIEAMRSW
jgi:hypothetical protein